MTTQRSNLLTVTLSFILAALLLVGAWCVADHRPAPDPSAPTATPWVIVVTATPGVQPAGPPTTRTATPTWTPRERLPMVEMTPTTREPSPMPTVTPSPEPTQTRVPATPVQKG